MAALFRAAFFLSGGEGFEKFGEDVVFGLFHLRTALLRLVIQAHEVEGAVGDEAG